MIRCIFTFFVVILQPLNIFCCNFAASNIEKDKSGMSIRGVKNRFVVVRFGLSLFGRLEFICLINKCIYDEKVYSDCSQPVDGYDYGNGSTNR